MKDKRPRPPVLDLMNQIDASEGMRRRIRSRAWAYMFYTFSVNALELQAIIRHYENPHSAIRRAAGGRGIVDEQLRSDLIRHLHNFLTAAKTLVDHTRNFMESVYAGEPLLDEYKAGIVSDVASSGVVPLVHDLRNYMLHREIPILRESLELKSGGPATFTVTLDLARMKSWGRWTSGAMAHINSLPRHARLLDIVDAYLEVVVRFHHKINRRRGEADAPLFEELRELQRQLRDATNADNQPDA